MPVETQTKQSDQPQPTQQQPQPSTSRRAADEGAEVAQDENADDDFDEDEMMLLPPQSQRTAYDRIYDVVGRFAATRLGQHVIERADRALRAVEDTAKWSLPQDKNSGPPLERPMSWIPFLYLIVILRCVRIALSLAALMIGNDPVLAGDVVYFIQTRRRKLRSIKMQGAKTMQEREHTAKSNSANSTNSGGGDGTTSIGGRLRSLFASAICRPGMHREASRRYCVSTETSALDITTTIRRDADESPNTSSGTVTVPETSPATMHATGKRPRDDEDDECLDEDLTADQMLTKYANANSEDDSDFEPNAHDTTNDEEEESVTSETTSEAGSGDEAEVQNNAPVKLPESQVQRENENAANADAGKGESGGGDAADEPNTTNGTSSNAPSSMTNHHNQSVEFFAEKQQQPQQRHDLNKQPLMPKPIIQIKKEYNSGSSDAEQATEDMLSPKENGDGGEAWQQPDVGRGHQQDTNKPAAVAKSKTMRVKMGNATAMAGSPPDWQTPNATPNAGSTEASVEATEQFINEQQRSYAQQQQNHHQKHYTHQQQQQQHQQNRNRNRNRR